MRKISEELYNVHFNMTLCAEDNPLKINYEKNKEWDLVDNNEVGEIIYLVIKFKEYFEYFSGNAFYLRITSLKDNDIYIELND